MKTVIGGDFVPRTMSSAVSATDSPFAVSNRAISLSAATHLLRMQQSSPHGVEVGQCGCDLQPMQVLGQTAVADLLEAEHSLDHPDGVLDFGAHLRLGPVL